MYLLSLIVYVFVIGTVLKHQKPKQFSMEIQILAKGIQKTHLLGGGLVIAFIAGFDSPM